VSARAPHQSCAKPPFFPLLLWPPSCRTPASIWLAWGLGVTSPKRASFGDFWRIAAGLAHLPVGLLCALFAARRKPLDRQAPLPLPLPCTTRPKAIYQPLPRPFPSRILSSSRDVFRREAGGKALFPLFLLDPGVASGEARQDKSSWRRRRRSRRRRRRRRRRKPFVTPFPSGGRSATYSRYTTNSGEENDLDRKICPPFLPSP